MLPPEFYYFSLIACVVATAAPSLVLKYGRNTVVLAAGSAEDVLPLVDDE